MKKTGICIFAYCIVTMLLISCGPPTQMDTGESKRCLPRSLSLEKTANNYALIAWDPGCSGTRIMRGFNIYLSSTPLVKKYPGAELPSSIEPFNVEIYPGDTVGDPDRETYECEDIENAVIYYAHVRAVYNDNSLSAPTNEIEIISYPQGEFSLAVSYSGSNDGFSFFQNSHCRTNDIENDLYFYHKDGVDYLCSPARLGPVNRSTKIYPGRKDSSLDDLLSAVDKKQPVEKAELRLNDVFLIITEDGYPARLQVTDINGNGEDRVVKFEYIYRPPVKSGGKLSS